MTSFSSDYCVIKWSPLHCWRLIGAVCLGLGLSGCVFPTAGFDDEMDEDPQRIVLVEESFPCVSCA
jgi:hypothetical protein